MKNVYAHVMSESAIYTLSKNGIFPQYDVSVKNIINREGTGNCPMEETVNNIIDPVTAVNAIRTKLLKLITESQ